MSDPNHRCPGKEKFLKSSDLPEHAFRRLVARRARQLVDRTAPVDSEQKRREAERAIQQHFEKISRGADFLPARFLTRGADRARAVCRIVTREDLGTGFLIADGVLMTNNHVLNRREKAASSVAEFHFEEGGSRTTVAIRPDLLFVTDTALDFTIVACETTGLDGIDPIPLLRTPATVTRHERVNVIQHPAGRPKEVALHQNEVVRVLDRVIRYETDTEPGSSGSPVFNNAWDLVALHHAGFFVGGGRAENEGIRIAAIVAHLLATGDEALRRHEALGPVLESVVDSSPYLGFFDTVGVRGPRGGLEVEVPDFMGTPDFADVGIWNIEHFNDRVADDRIERVADVVNRLALDVLGLVEVQQGALHRLVDALNERGFSTDFRVLNVPGTQDLAVLFDQETTNVRLRSDIAQRQRHRLDAETSSGRSAFPRDPLFAECTVHDNDVEVRFLLIVVHLKAFGDATSRARRRLAADMLAEIIEDIRATDGIPVVLGGDFNETLNTDVLSSVTDAPDLIALTSDDANTDAISYVGDSHRSLIDHFVVSHDVRMGEISGDDAAIVRLDQTVADFADEVSDHVPLVFRMVLRDQPIEPISEDSEDRVEIPRGARALRWEFDG